MENKDELSALQDELSAIRKELKENSRQQKLGFYAMVTLAATILLAVNNSTLLLIMVGLLWIGGLICLIYTSFKDDNKACVNQNIKSSI
jgi:fatty acid desaturase